MKALSGLRLQELYLGESGTVKYAQAMKALQGVDDLKLSLQEAAAIQMESGYPTNVISQFHSMKEYNVFKKAGLKPQMVNGKIALVRKDIDINIIDEFGMTNLERMKNGNAPLSADGKTFDLHHVGQEADATLAILKKSEHQKFTKDLHVLVDKSKIDRSIFEGQKKKIWKTMATMLEEGLK